jgi:hypothetical protein
VPLSSSNIVQTNTGSTGANAAATLDVTVSSATTGHTVLVGIVCDEPVTPPAGGGFLLDQIESAGGGRHHLLRKQTSTGETTWTFVFDTSAIAAWWVDEVSGLDPAPLAALASNHDETPPSTISTSTTTSTSADDLYCVASFASWNSSNLTVTWSGYTNSFTEAHDTATTFSGSTEVSIAIARRFPGTPGSFETTATLSSAADASAILAVYKASTTAPVVIDDVPVGGSFGLAATVTARDGSGTHLDLRTVGVTVQGAIVISAGLSVTGTMNFALSAVGITLASQPFTVGQIVADDDTGQTLVVRDAWSEPAGFFWSSATNRSVIYPTSGFTVVGQATLS